VNLSPSEITARVCEALPSIKNAKYTQADAQLGRFYWEQDGKARSLAIPMELINSPWGAYLLVTEFLVAAYIIGEIEAK
jgi:hypothetical protein